jgi:hypothetical protein
MSRSIALPLALALLLLAATPGPVRAGSAIGDPGYEWTFFEYLSDGAGGFTGPFEVDAGEQPGGALAKSFTLTTMGVDHLNVFASEGAEDFWASARAPLANPEDVGAEVGGRTELTVSQVFRKDASDATLTFTIPGSVLSVRDFAGDEDTIVSAIVVHTLTAGDFNFAEEARLDGHGGDWTFVENGQGDLPYALTSGGLDQSGVLFAFSEPFERTVDLSAVLTGSEFTVTYHLVAEGVDTAQTKSVALAAAGYDGVDETEGISFEFTGLTPIGVPEPGAALLLAAGAGVLWATRRRAPAHRSRGAAERPAPAPSSPSR